MTYFQLPRVPGEECYVKKLTMELSNFFVNSLVTKLYVKKQTIVSVYSFVTRLYVLQNILKSCKIIMFVLQKCITRLATMSMFIRGFHLHSAMSYLSILCTSSHDGITINIVIPEYVWNVHLILNHKELEFVDVILTLCTLAQRKLR